MDDSLEPQQQPLTNTVSPEAATDTETDERPPDTPSGSQIPPAPPPKCNAEHCRPDQTPWWKYMMELAAILVGIAVASIYYRQLDTMQKANELTKTSYRLFS